MSSPEYSSGAILPPPPSDALQPISIATRYRLALVRDPSPEYAKPIRCSRPEAAAPFIQQLLQDRDREVVGVVMLAKPHMAIGHVIAYIGTQVRAAVEPRGLLVPALLANAAGIILFHNHPSGDPTPSASDVAFSRRLASAAELVGLLLTDSLIVTPEGPWVSMYQRGLLRPPESTDPGTEI